MVFNVLRRAGGVVAKKPLQTAGAVTIAGVGYTQRDKIGGAIENVGEGVGDLTSGLGNLFEGGGDAFKSAGDNLPLILLVGGGIALAVLLKK